MNRTYFTYLLSYFILSSVLGWFISIPSTCACLALVCCIKEYTVQADGGASDAYSLLFGFIGATIGLCFSLI